MVRCWLSCVGRGHAQSHPAAKIAQVPQRELHTSLEKAPTPLLVPRGATARPQPGDKAQGLLRREQDSERLCSLGCFSTGPTLPPRRERGLKAIPAREGPRQPLVSPAGPGPAPHGAERGERGGWRRQRRAAGWEDEASPAPAHAPGGVALRHMLLNCFGRVLQKSSEVGRGKPGAALPAAGEAAWL